MHYNLATILYLPDFEASTETRKSHLNGNTSHARSGYALYGI